MNKYSRARLSSAARWTRLLPLFLGSGLILSGPLSAQVTFKANNTAPLQDPSSWVEGIVPDGSTMAVWDSRVTGANSSSLGESATWRGIRLLNPGGAVNISGATLILGAGGLDLSEATQNLQFSNTIDFLESQKIQAGTGRAISFGEVSRRGAVGLEFKIGANAEVRYGGFLSYWLENDFIRAGSQIYATHNGTDYAALENVWPNARILPGRDVRPDLYTPNPSVAPGNLDDWILLMDFVNDVTNARASGNRTVYNLRFNQPNTNFPEWVVDTAASNRVITISSVLVTENVGPQNVRFSGPGTVRVSNTSGGLQIFQNNPQGDLIFGSAWLSAQNPTRILSKHGPGRVIVDSIASYGGATAVFEGTLRFTNELRSPTHGVTVHGGATLDVAGAILDVSGISIREGGWMAGRGTVRRSSEGVLTVTNHGDIVVDVQGNTFRFEGDVVNHGTITVLNGAHLEILGNFTNYGVIDYADGFASLPEGYVNEGTVIPGRDGPPPPLNADTRISDVSLDQEGRVVVSVPSVLGVKYQLERSASLREPAAEPARLAPNADTVLGNDPAGAPRVPDGNYGTLGTLDLRRWDGVRRQFPMFRFDIGALTANHLLDEATLSFYFSTSPNSVTFEVWGVTDETLDHWIESGEGGVTYNNFGGTLPADPGYLELNLAAVELLGTFSVTNVGNRVYSSNPVSLPLGNFLRASTNNVVSFIVVHQGTESVEAFFIVGRLNGGIGDINPVTGVEVIPPTLTVPTAASIADRASEPWRRVETPTVSGTGATITFTDIPGERNRLFYRVVSDLE
jgi:hypothetical protein